MPVEKASPEEKRRTKMKTIDSWMRRLIGTASAVLLGLGLGLMGPATALADGVEKGLNFTIVSDEVSKTASGSVPAPPSGYTASDTTAAESGSAGGDSGSTTALASADSSTTSSPDSGSDGSDYNTSTSLNAKNETNSASGKQKNR